MSFTEDFKGGRAAVYLGSGLIAGFCLLALIGFAEHSDGVAVEHTRQPTALGDVRFFEAPTGGDRVPVFHLHGKPLFLGGLKERPMEDVDMRRVVRDPESGLSLYKSGVEGAEAEFFLRTAPGIFLKVTAEP